MPRECWHQRHYVTTRPPPRHVSTFSRARRFAVQSSHFITPQVSAEYRKGKGQLATHLGLNREFVLPKPEFYGTFEGTGVPLRTTGENFALSKVNRVVSAPESHYGKAMLNNIHPLESPPERAYCSACLRAHPGPVPPPVLRHAGPLGSSRLRLGFSRSGLRLPLPPGVATLRPVGISRCPTRAARPALPQNSALTEDLARVAFGEHTAAQLSRAHMDLEL